MLLGVVAVLSYASLEATGGTYPGWCGGYIGLMAAIFRVNVGYPFNWEMGLVIGAILGAALAAVLSKEWKLRVPRPRLLAQSLIGGLVMGFGAVVGDGCNIATILIGVPLFSIGSILAGIFTVLGVWAAAYVMFR